MIALFKISIIFTILLGSVICLPVGPPKKPVQEPKNDTSKNLEDYLEYERYLKEVVQALESDPDFRKKLEKAPEADIRTGKIAQDLEYVSHHVRSKLDEIKRKELDRLRSLATKQFELENDIDRVHLKVPEHIDHKNEHTFEIEDLKKLILQTSKDLEAADRERKDEFKQYEMQKEFEKQSVLNELDEENKKKYEEELKKQKEKHDKHAKVHHPGNQAQLEEVWEKQDHMEGVDFDPKSFFMMHDVDGNGVWDQTELKALFVKELDKVYRSGAPEDDIRERAEEMERMREHVFQESDTNHDGLISYQEFLAQTRRDDFQTDPEWETVDKVPQFTHEEYLEFERKRQEEIQRLIAQGQLPPHPNMPQGYYPRQGVPPQGYQQVPGNQIHPQGYQQQQQIPQPVQFNQNQQYAVHNGQAQQFPQQGQQFPQQGQQFPQQGQQAPQQGQQFPQQGQQFPQVQQYQQQGQQLPSQQQQLQYAQQNQINQNGQQNRVQQAQYQQPQQVQQNPQQSQPQQIQQNLSPQQNTINQNIKPN